MLLQVMGSEKSSSRDFFVFCDAFSITIALEGEDPHKHLKEFHVMCSTMRLHGTSKDYIKMKAFPFSLDATTKVVPTTNIV
ncbi:hypothetical protein CR513_60889, partial [Mucuna pruriens]